MSIHAPHLDVEGRVLAWQVVQPRRRSEKEALDAGGLVLDTHTRHVTGGGCAFSGVLGWGWQIWGVVVFAAGDPQWQWTLYLQPRRIKDPKMGGAEVLGTLLLII